MLKIDIGSNYFFAVFNILSFLKINLMVLLAWRWDQYKILPEYWLSATFKYHLSDVNIEGGQ